MSARRSGSFMVSASDKSSNPLARYSLVRFTAPLSRGCLSSRIKFLNPQNGSSVEYAVKRSYCLAYHQEFCVCKCIRPASPLEQKTAYDVPRASAGHHGMSCTTREGRPSCHERPCLSDAWLSCAGSGELAPEIGIFSHN